MKRFNNILCVVEPSDNAQVALLQTLMIAKGHQSSVAFVAAQSKVYAVNR